MAFTPKGDRLGRGKGYYDTYLQQASKSGSPPETIALSFRQQLVQVRSLTQLYSVRFLQSFKKVCFVQTNNKGLHQLFLTVCPLPWDLRAFGPHLTVSLLLCSCGGNAGSARYQFDGP